jgi:deoxyadenosine/deoxycytidine kinase
VICKLGGTYASGKTTFARALMDVWSFTPTVMNARKTKVIEYEATIKPDQPLYGVFKKVVVLGSYLSVCGGMDTISSLEERLALVGKYCGTDAKPTLCFFEGVYMSTYGALGELSERSKVPWLYVGLDTPIELCLERLIKRRAERGVTAPFEGGTRMKDMEDHIKKSQSTLRRAEAYGHATLWLTHKQSPAQQVKTFIKKVKEVAE